jgi:regulatory protein
MLGQRELSEAQVRTRLARRGCEPAAVDEALARLKRDRTLDDSRVARAAARLEAGIRHRGPARVRQRLQSLGLTDDVIQAAVTEAFEEVDEAALLDAAIERRLRGRTVADLDDKARARLVRSLVGQGFSLAAVLRKARRQPASG